MNKSIARILASLLLAVLALVSTGQAQRVQQVIKANIPFEFHLGKQVFPAGSYFLASSAPIFLELRDSQGRTLATVLTNSVETLKRPSSPKLEFYSQGGGFSLAQVWQENYSVGQQLRQPKEWKKTAKRRDRQRRHRRRQQRTVVRRRDKS